MDIKAHLIPHHGWGHQIIIPCRKFGEFFPPLGNFAKRKAKVGTGAVGEGREVLPGHPLVQICFPAASVLIFGWQNDPKSSVCPWEMQRRGAMWNLPRACGERPGAPAPECPLLVSPRSRCLHVPEASGAVWIPHRGPASSKGLCWDGIPVWNVGFCLPCPCSGGFAVAPCPRCVPAVSPPSARSCSWD